MYIMPKGETRRGRWEKGHRIEWIDAKQKK